MAVNHIKKELNSIADTLSTTTLRVHSVRPSDYDAAHNRASYILPLNDHYREILSESKVMALSKCGHPQENIILVQVNKFIEPSDVPAKLRDSLRHSMGKPGIEVCAVEVVFLFTMPSIRMYGACRRYPKELFKKSIKEHVKTVLEGFNERIDKDSEEDKKTIKKEKACGARSRLRYHLSPDANINLRSEIAGCEKIHHRQLAQQRNCFNQPIGDCWMQTRGSTQEVGLSDTELWERVYHSAENGDWSPITNNTIVSRVLTMERENKHLLFLAAAKAHVEAFQIILSAVRQEDGAAKVISELNDRGPGLMMSIYRGGSCPIVEHTGRSSLSDLLYPREGPFCRYFFSFAKMDHDDLPLHADIFEAALKNDVDQLERSGPTRLVPFSCMGSLYFAAKKGYVRVVEMLLSALEVAECNLRNECNRSFNDFHGDASLNVTPLWIAYKEGRSQVVQTYPIVDSLCILCVKRNDVEMLKVVLESEITCNDLADDQKVYYRTKMEDYLDRLDQQGNTALMLAVRSDHESGPTMVKMLLDKSAHTETTDANGMTALHLACMYGREDVIRMLIDGGACVDALSHRVQIMGDDYHIYDTVGPTPLQLARDRPGVVKMLLAAGAIDSCSRCVIEPRKSSIDNIQAILPPVQDNGSDAPPTWCSDLVMHRIIDHLHWSDVLSLCQVSRQWRRSAIQNQVWASFFYELCSSFHHPSAVKYEYSVKWKMREGFFYQLCHILFPDLLRVSWAISLYRPLDLQCSWSEWKQQMKIGKILRNAQRSLIGNINSMEERTLFVCHRKKRTTFTCDESGRIVDPYGHLTCTAIFLTSASRFSIVTTTSQEDGYLPDGTFEAAPEDAVNGTIDVDLEAGTVHLKRGGTVPVWLYRMADISCAGTLIALHPRLPYQCGLQHRTRCRVIRAIQMNKSWSPCQRKEALDIVDRIMLIDSTSIGLSIGNVLMQFQRTFNFVILCQDTSHDQFAFRFSVYRDRISKECPLFVSHTLAERPHFVNMSKPGSHSEFSWKMMDQTRTENLKEADVKWLMLRVFKCGHLIDHEKWRDTDEDERIRNSGELQDTSVGIQVQNEKEMRNFDWMMHRGIKRTERLMDVLGQHLIDFTFSYEDEPSRALRTKGNYHPLHEEDAMMQDQIGKGDISIENGIH
ncbi:protein TANC2-like isoform 1 [Planoprotostelium fungivorum]|uniref:Protein TANC2-like isoform 1 n=1 Tax=Planoprotostelium fungivorum TaxID=1890364 RepID=A0A2P6MYV5_9EUKA|nr:protein TANC2-like isoform 1 [Planoprotostelium fungivorum]